MSGERRECGIDGKLWHPVRSVMVGLVSLGLCLTTSLGVSGCKKKAAEPKPLVNLKVGHLPVTGHAKFFVGVEEKFF